MKHHKLSRVVVQGLLRRFDLRLKHGFQSGVQENLVHLEVIWEPLRNLRTKGGLCLRVDIREISSPSNPHLFINISEISIDLKSLFITLFIITLI